VTGLLIIDSFLLLLLTLIAVFVVQSPSLFAAATFSGLYGLVMALVWTNMHAMDVAFTEAAVGAGISTILLLGAMVYTGRHEKKREGEPKVNFRALSAVVLTGGALVYGTLDMPQFGDPNAVIHHHRVAALLHQVVGKYDRPDDRQFAVDAESWVEFEEKADTMEKTVNDRLTIQLDSALDIRIAPWQKGDDFASHVPNSVTTLLAAYRGYDTLFETAVIFTAGMSLVLLLSRKGSRTGTGIGRKKGNHR